MEQRDIIKDQIEQLVKLKSIGKGSEGIIVSNEQLKSELDLSIHDLITLSKPALKKYLEDRRLTSGHFETLAKYLKEIGEDAAGNDKPKAMLYFTKSIELLDLEDEITEVLSYDRLQLKLEIEALIEGLS